jgi:hypothetical protein
MASPQNLQYFIYFSLADFRQFSDPFIQQIDDISDPNFLNARELKYFIESFSRGLIRAFLGQLRVGRVVAVDGG